MQGTRATPRLRFGPEISSGDRVLPREVAVALSFNGTTQAVMMATPDHLADFAHGFALTEGFAHPSEIDSLEVVETPLGLDVQMWVGAQTEARLKARRRVLAGPVGCGLCGIDSLEHALRQLDPVAPSSFRMRPAQIMTAIAALPQAQPLHDATRAAHCAAWWNGERIALTREDIGRHNALDKLAGAMEHTQIVASHGAVVLTSRVSIDLVQKVAAIGAPIVIAVSSPTADAVELAEQLGITLIAQARPDGFEAYTHTDRIMTEAPHVR